MRKILPLFVLSIFLCSSFAFAQGPGNKPEARVIAYYLHGNFRCPTCHAMEKYSKEAIENNFKNELASGKLEFKAVNTDERGNEHFVQDYQLYTKSLVLSLVKDGKETKTKNLTEIWNRVRNKQSFIDYVKKEVSDFLKEAE